MSMHEVNQQLTLTNGRYQIDAGPERGGETLTIVCLERDASSIYFTSEAYQSEPPPEGLLEAASARWGKPLMFEVSASTGLQLLSQSRAIRLAGPGSWAVRVHRRVEPKGAGADLPAEQHRLILWRTGEGE